jgi:peptide/nickel transport system substrate-binding protein
MYIGWNALRPDLGDKRVRRALTLSIDRDTILKELLHDLGSVCSGTFFSLSPYNDPNIKPWPYDPAAAAKLFAEAGWTRDSSGFLQKDGKRLEIKINFPAASEVGKKILVAAQSDLKKAGVQCALDPIEWAVFLEKIKKLQFDACTLRWHLSWDPDPYQLWHSSQAVENGSNHCSFKNNEADEIIEKLRRTFDKDERVRLCHRFHAILHEEQPYTFLFNDEDLFGHNADLRNVYLPLKPGEKRGMYFPIVQAYNFTRFWWMPKADQHK